MDIKSQWLSVVLIATSLGTLGGWFAAHQQLQQSVVRLNLLTPVFVMDRARMIRLIPPNASQEQMTQIVNDWQARAKKLSDAGYLVIDSTAVVAAPGDLYIQAP